MLIISDSYASFRLFFNYTLLSAKCKLNVRFLFYKLVPTFGIDFIGICNMNPPCPMCLNWEGERGPRHHKGMRKEDFFIFDRYFQNAFAVINCGIGEPLLNPDLVQILKMFYEEGKEFGFNSNGLALTKGLSDQILPYSPILTVIFSLDAATPETYRKIRADNFGRVVDNISYYCQNRRKMFGNLPTKTGICFMPMEWNKHEIPELFQMAAQMGVDVVELRSLINVDRPIRVHRKGYLFDYQEQQLSDDELEDIRHLAEEESKKNNVRFDCQYSFNEDYTYEVFVPKGLEHVGIPCILPWRYALAYQNGDTVGCNYMNRSLGNWREVGLDALWNGERMVKMRHELAQGRLAEECLEYDSCPLVRRHFPQGVPHKKYVTIEQETPQPSFWIRLRVFIRNIPVIGEMAAFAKRMLVKVFSKNKKTGS